MVIIPLIYVCVSTLCIKISRSWAVVSKLILLVEFPVKLILLIIALELNVKSNSPVFEEKILSLVPLLITILPSKVPLYAILGYDHVDIEIVLLPENLTSSAVIVFNDILFVADAVSA